MHRYILLYNYVQICKITTINDEYENIQAMLIIVKAHYCHRFTHT